MFCGFCSNDADDGSEIVIRDTLGHLSTRVSRNNRSEILGLVAQSKNYSMILASKYDYYKGECETKGTLFNDPEFPANAASVGVQVNHRKIVWRRITDVVKNAVMVENSIDPDDIQQGNVGDCYFLAAISSIAEVPSRIRKIFCDEMEISKHGIYRLQVASQGQLKEIVIDDLIPVFDGSFRPVFCKPKNNEIWVMLLEKAWAKISGSYGNTSSGYPHEVLNTFLEAPCFYYEITLTAFKSQAERQNLWAKISEGQKNQFPMCAGSRQAHVCKGIKPAHTYSLLSCYEVKADKQTVRMIKLRNPWGDKQYRGKYSEYDEPFWSRVSPAQKEKALKNNSINDGVFVMELTEFLRNFQSLDISHSQDRRNYNYVFANIHTPTEEPFYYDLEVSEKSEGQFYFTIEKAFNRTAFIRERRVNYGYSRIVISRVTSSVVDGKTQNEFQYVDSKLETNFPDLTIRCKNLVPGRYIIYGESAFPDQAEGSVTLSVYSQAKMDVSKLPSPPDKYFLHKVFIDYANIFPQNKMNIQGLPNDWTSSKFLFEEGGFGYIMASLGRDSLNRIKIVCDIEQINKSGFHILERGIPKPSVGRKNEGRIQIDIGPGEQGILILGIYFSGAPIRQIDFPPKGIKISRII